MLRLCVIANPNSIHTHRWVGYFAQRGHQVHLIGDKPPRRALPPGVILHDLTATTNRRKVRYAVWAEAVRRLVREIRPDVLHAHQVSSAGWLAAAAGYHPFEVTAWGSDLLVNPQRSRAQRWLARWVLRRADYVTCVSAALADVALTLGADRQRVEVAPWGVDTGIFHPLDEPARRALRAQLALADGPVVASLRAFQPIYNPLDVAQAIAPVLARVPAVQFVVFVYNEDPALLARFKDLVEAAQGGEAVRYIHDLPHDQAIAQYLQVADAAISVPSSDGTPLSVLEAMACGAVPVVSDVPSLREWIEPQENGLLVPVGDSTALGAAVANVLAHAPAQERMRRQAVATVRARGDREVLMRRHEAIYRQLIQECQP
jgi:glycosyltransferase involved in cell wall biosynthesis